MIPAPSRTAEPSSGRHRSEHPPRRPESEHGFRPDVQGLRAVAVGLVVIYHLYPKTVPGGYIGVDVFFVISGFLITGHLARTMQRSGRVRLLDFYGRRARRLLPAAALVLTVTWLVSRALLPVTQLPAAADQIRASALYFQNWVLAHDSVDYLTQDAAPSPVQHFWSLSVEEQFYLVWPSLFLVAGGAAALVARRARGDATRARRRIGRGFLLALAGAVVAASFVYSISKTHQDPAAAYYITTTRMWELGAGGVLALLPAAATRRIGRVGLLAWIGIGLIVASAFTLSGSSAFPGWVALVPVLGAVLMIACGGETARLGPARLTACRPFVFVGDISYSLYLWHWPIIVLWGAYTGRPIGVRDGIAIVAVAIVLSWLTKVLVEDTVRRAPVVVRHPAASLATALSVALPAVLVTTFLVNQPGAFQGRPDAQHPGAQALARADRIAQERHRVGTHVVAHHRIHKPTSPHPSPSAHRTHEAAVIPPLAEVPRDLPLAQLDHCEIGSLQTELGTDPAHLHACTFGDTKHPILTVALVGDSHAAQWSSALDVIGKRLHWKIVAEVHSACRWTPVMTVLFGQAYTACQQWGASVLHDLLTNVQPNVVIVSDRPVTGTWAHPAGDSVSWAQIGTGTARYLRDLIRHGIRVVAIHETPEPGRNIPDCLAARTGSVQTCSTPTRDAVWKHTPIDVAAAELGKQLPVVNLNNLICGPSTCKPIVGNVIVYRDQDHLSRTFSLTLQHFLQRDLLDTGAFPATSPDNLPPRPGR